MSEAVVPKVAYVYMVECADGTLYIGWSYDPAARLKQHNSGRGAKYTRSRLPVRLVYTETLPDESSARRREIALKKLTRAQKMKLAASFEPRASSHEPEK
jgi:putative endonuclease